MGGACVQCGTRCYLTSCVNSSLHVVQERTEDKDSSKEKRKRETPPPVVSAKEVETKVGMQLGNAADVFPW